jgi:hypothetical protein
VDDLAIRLTIPAAAIYTLASGDLHVHGDYEADALINYMYIIPILGSGNLTASIKNLAVDADVRIVVNLITNRFIITAVTLNVQFAEVFGYAEGLKICDEVVDWDAVNEDAKPAFDQFWTENKAEIEQLVKEVLAELLKVTI